MVLLLCLVACVMSPDAEAAPSRVADDFYGMNVQGLGPGISAADRVRALSRMAGAGIQTQRVPLGWAPLQAVEGGPFSWDAPDVLADTQVRAAAERGIRTTLVGASSPPWAVAANDRELARRSAGDTIEESHFFPAEGREAAWQAFWRATAARYGVRGSFWADNPTLPYLPVRQFEIWNEPNYEATSADGVQPARYGVLYRLAREAVHSADPTALAVLGGLAGARRTARDPRDGNRLIMRTTEFLDGMGLGADDPLDALGLHSYARPIADTFGPIKDVRDWLDARGRKNVGIVVNEWGSVGPEYADGVAKGDPEGVRAAYFDTVADQLSRSDCGIRSIATHTWRTARASRTSYEDWFGIVSDFDVALTDGPARGPLPALERRIASQTGATVGGSRQTVHACGRSAPNADGDAQPDENDIAPLDSTITAVPGPAARPVVHEAPALRGSGALGDVDRQADGAPDRFEVGETVRTQLGSWDGSPAPRRIVLRWEHCAAGGAGCAPVARTQAERACKRVRGTPRRRARRVCRVRSGPQGLRLTEDLLGRRVRAIVRASNAAGSATVAGELSRVVGAPPRGEGIEVAGPQRVGATVTALPRYTTLPEAVGVRYVWRSCPERDCPVLQDDTRNTYRIPLAMEGRRLSVEARVTNRYGTAFLVWISPTPVRLR